MIKLIIFDLDGVLVTSKHVHFISLNLALKSVSEEYILSLDDHLGRYDGLSTRKKLQLLTQERGLPENKHDEIWKNKQIETIKLFSNIEIDNRLIGVVSSLKQNYKIACCTNSIRETALIQLEKKGLLNFIDVIYTNEDVKYTKPHAQLYMKCMVDLDVNPDETIILEDSFIGRRAASRSGAYVLPVDSPEEVTLDKVQNFIMKIENNQTVCNKWESDKLNILIPMAGAGSRFEKAGYTFPKPLIEVNGKPMIQVVVDNINIDAQFIFIVQQSHLDKYNLNQTLNLIAPGCKIVVVNGLTEGAACTTLLAKNYIDNDFSLLLANSDQFVEWCSDEFMYNMTTSNVDAGILTFKSTHPKWSYAKLNEQGFVEEVAEKNPISDIVIILSP
jgi:HAD superfamily hydrolase (TIGR01509 family)